MTLRSRTIPDTGHAQVQSALICGQKRTRFWAHGKSAFEWLPLECGPPPVPGSGGCSGNVCQGSSSGAQGTCPQPLALGRLQVGCARREGRRCRPPAQHRLGQADLERCPQLCSVPLLPAHLQPRLPGRAEGWDTGVRGSQEGSPGGSSHSPWSPTAQGRKENCSPHQWLLEHGTPKITSLCTASNRQVSDPQKGGQKVERRLGFLERIRKNYKGGCAPL